MPLMPLRLATNDDITPFPDVRYALTDPDGLLAIGGNLSSQRLLKAYKNGIFPWFNDDQPILWWSPNPRAVLFPEQMKVSRSLRKTIRQKIYTTTFNQAFDQVIEACAAPRGAKVGTWITSDMAVSYRRLHQQGYAYSVEAWHNQKLVGGLYGVTLGKVFFGESMFSRKTDASKVALYALTQYALDNHFHLIDCQVASDHLSSLGAISIPREDFIKLLRQWC